MRIAFLNTKDSIHSTGVKGQCPNTVKCAGGKNHKATFLDQSGSFADDFLVRGFRIYGKDLTALHGFRCLLFVVRDSLFVIRDSIHDPRFTVFHAGFRLFVLPGWPTSP